MLYREIIAVCSMIHTKHINTLCGQNVELLNVKPGSTYSNRWALDGTFKDPVRTAQKAHSVPVTKTSQLMLYREIIAVCSEIHTKHINTLCGQNVELLSVKPGDEVSKQCDLMVKQNDFHAVTTVQT
jgi:tryptophanase